MQQAVTLDLHLALSHSLSLSLSLTLSPSLFLSCSPCLYILCASKSSWWASPRQVAATTLLPLSTTTSLNTCECACVCVWKWHKKQLARGLASAECFGTRNVADVAVVAVVADVAVVAAAAAAHCCCWRTNMLLAGSATWFWGADIKTKITKTTKKNSNNNDKYKFNFKKIIT